MANVQVIQRHAHLAGAVKLEFVNGREGKIAKAVLTAISNTRRGSGDSPRGGVHRDPVDAVGQAGRERRRVPGQGLARQHRRPAAQQQLREGRRNRLRHGVHGRGDRLPRQPRRVRSPPQRWPRCRRRHRRSAERPSTAGREPQAPQRAPAGARRRLNPHRVGVMPIEPRPPFEPHSTIEGNHHVLDPDPGDPLCPQHPRDARRPAPERRPDARRGAVHLRRGQAREPLRALHLHPHHRCPARPAQGGLRALHGRPGRQPRRRQGGVHQAHDPHAPRRAGADPARGERDHPDQQPRRRQLVPDARRHVPLRLLQRPGGGRGGGGHPHPAQGQHPGRGDRRRVPRARRVRGGGASTPRR